MVEYLSYTQNSQNKNIPYFIWENLNQFLECLFLSKRQQHSEEMKENLAQLKTRRLYFEQIASERAAKEAEAEETEKIRVSWQNN